MMKLEKINSKNYDKSFLKLLEDKKDENVVKGRFDIEPVIIEEKIDFIIRLISSHEISSLTYKILFWENEDIIQSFIQSNKDKVFEIVTPYKNDEKPGIIFIDDSTLDEFFFKKLLINHFNYELANDPSLNIRVQICINYEDYIILLDIYDDRGFDIYYLKK